MDDIIDRLKKMRINDCQYEKSESGAVKLTVTVQVGKKSEGDEADKNGFSATAVISCAPDYPESCASVQIVSSSGVSSEAITEMTKRVTEVANEKKGEECVPLLIRIVRRYLLDQRVHECPACKADLVGGQSDSWRSHCGHFYHRACIISLIQTSARAQQENWPEGGDDEQPAQAAERRPVCPACGLYEFTLRDDKPISRRINKPGSGGGRFRGRRGRNQHSGDGEVVEGEAGQGDQRRRRPRRPRNRRGGPGENAEPAGGEGEGEHEGDAAPGQRRQRKRNPNRRRRQQQRSGGEGDGDAEVGGDDPKLFNQRRQADMRFNEFEQLRNQVGSGNGKGGGRRGGGGYQGDFPQPGYVDENGGFYAPDGYYYYDGPRGFYSALEAYGGGGRGGPRGGGGGGGGRRRNRPRRPRGDGSNGNAGAPAEEAPVAEV